MKRIKITVRGKVQGVGFRDATKNTAEVLALAGFVQNLKNGSVYIEAEGSIKQIDKFVDWLHSGPDAAKVEHIEVQSMELMHSTSFTINF